MQVVEDHADDPAEGTVDFSDPYAHDPSVEHALTPLWREARWGLDWMRLRMSSVYFGRGVAHGQGEPVVLVPGFMAGDWMLLELQRWLQRVGYRAYLSRIVWNNDCPDKTARALAHRIRGVHQTTRQKVRLIGHSLGGMLAKSVVQDHPGMIDRVITLGSPFRSLVKAHPAVVGIWDQLKGAQSGLIGRNLSASCGTGHCMCDFVRNMIQPRPASPAQFAVYSRLDGVADWSSCLEEDEERNTEVNCTHMGLAYHPDVYRAIAKRLAQPL